MTTCKDLVLLFGAATMVAPFAFFGVRRQTGRGEFQKTQISAKMKPNNPTTQHFDEKNMEEGLCFKSILLKFKHLLNDVRFVGFVGKCWVCVGFMLGFAPFCWVLNVKFEIWQNVKMCKCWVSKCETQQKPTCFGVFPNKPNGNPTLPTGVKNVEKPHHHYVLTIFTNFNVGLLGLKCKYTPLPQYMSI